jgi:hypothetical protein
MLKNQNLEAVAASPGGLPEPDALPVFPGLQHANTPSIPPSPNPSIPLSLQPLPLSALAELLGSTRSTIRHFADLLGFRYTIRRIGPRRKRAACLTPEQAQAIATEIERETAACASSSSSENAQTCGQALASQQPGTKNQEPRNAEGHFYLLQLEPKHDPGRFKLGFSSDLESRLDDLLTVVPLAKLIATWPALRSWERTAIVSVAQDAEAISQEVFRTDRLEEVIAAADRFFSVMPKLPAQIQMPYPSCVRLPISAARILVETYPGHLPQVSADPAPSPASGPPATPAAEQSEPTPPPPPGDHADLAPFHALFPQPNRSRDPSPPPIEQNNLGARQGPRETIAPRRFGCRPEGPASSQPRAERV